MQADNKIEAMIKLLARLPGLGPRSARRALLHLLARRKELLTPLSEGLAELALRARACRECHMLTLSELCAICADPKREQRLLCVVEETGDVFAMERAGVMRGRYHVLGGVLSALDGMTPEKLHCNSLFARAARPEVEEVILATNATLDGQSTAHYLAAKLESCGVEISRLARGMPLGGELDYLDSGTLADALERRENIKHN